ncbi:Holliday junction DNA helicase subunit RuvA [Laceyella sediminis]|uniref:Holliday junction branch migration complex subunit RuvA n=1 Tax=Laceyella sediminis TaxID=573074 RepID=A0ABX5ER20_9BACL|nr:Holliday junction branch migration protein RuvA [Laceyella sediminis]PRZ15804.1 Holliday junction DNA helicase subunit RuvA [Laceyella sediminis]
MIEFVKGEVVYHEADYLAVDVRGLGHQVFVPNPFAFADGEEVMLYTHFVVREDAQLLYGFKTKRERNLFRLLLEVSGVGPKAALAMLTHMSPEALVRAIHIEDVKTLTKLPGVGKKTAQRLVLDLKDKLAKLGWEPGLDLAAETASLPPVVPNAERDVIDALLALGYNEEEAEWAVRESGQTIDASVSTEEWIKKALQAMMKR